MSKALLILLAGLLVVAGVYVTKPVQQAEPTAVCGESCGALPRRSLVGLARVERVRLGEGDLLRGVPGEGPLSIEEVRAWLADPANHRQLIPELPVGLDGGALDIRGLQANPLSRAKIELGRQLYFDPRLSRDGTVSCASCHDPEHGYAMPTRFGVGVEGQEGPRNSPTAANRILSDAQFWDGRAGSLEEQAIGPMANAVEMASSHEAVVGLVGTLEGYRLQFERVFDEGVTIENVGRAIAAFERAIVSGPNAWDHHRRLSDFESAYADELDDLDEELTEEHGALKAAAAASPLSEPAARGADLFFGDAGCTQCHAGANFSDERYHNLGVGFEEGTKPVDWGRYEITKDEADRGTFKTPGLRNVAQTAPYMHDGSQQTLADVVAWYAQGGHPNPHLSPLIEPLDLDESQQADLVAFLESLTGEWPAVETGRLPAKPLATEKVAP